MSRSLGWQPERGLRARPSSAPQPMADRWRPLRSGPARRSKDLLTLSGEDPTCGTGRSADDRPRRSRSGPDEKHPAFEGRRQVRGASSCSSWHKYSCLPSPPSRLAVFELGLEEPQPVGEVGVVGDRREMLEEEGVKIAY